MVKVESVVKLAADFLGLRDCIDRVLDDDWGDNDYAVYNGLIRCYNLVETEVATDYAPLVCEEKISCNGGKADYEKLSRSPAYIIAVLDRFGNKVKFRLFPTYFAAADGEYTARYAALPKTKDISDECECAPSVTQRVIAYGVAAEYCVQNGLYAEHAVWDKKFKNGLAAACKQRGGQTLKGRSWV